MLHSVLLQRAQGLGVACTAGRGVQPGSSFPVEHGRQETAWCGALELSTA